MRAVLDTNVLVSAVLSPSGAPAAVWRAFRDDRFQLLTSDPLLDELRLVLARPRIARRSGWSTNEQRLFVALVEESATLVTPIETLHVIRANPADDRVLEAAVAGEADYIVSGDRHLLDLGAYEDIPMITPSRFVAVLALDGDRR